MWTENDLVSFELFGEARRGFVTETWPNPEAPSPLVRVWLVEADAVMALRPESLTLVNTRDQRLGYDPTDDFPFDRWMQEEEQNVRRNQP